MAKKAYVKSTGIRSRSSSKECKEMKIETNSAVAW